VRVVEPLHADALRSTEQLQQAFGSSKHTIFGASLAPGDLVPVRDVTVESVAAGIRSVGPRPRVLLPPLAEHSRWPAWLTLEIEAPEATIVRLIPSPDDEAGAREPSLCRTLAEGWNAVAFVVAPLQAGRMCLELGSARGPFRLENVALLRPRATLGAPPSPPPGGGRISPQLATPLS
jgi:hypothetical protein